MSPPLLPLLPLLLDRALVLLPCTPAPDAPCWQDPDTPRLTTFDAPSGLRLAPARADVRLAHDGQGHLLARIADLPPDTTVEIQIRGDDTYARLGEGTHTLSLSLSLSPDTLHSAQVGLLTPAGPLPWTLTAQVSVEDTFPLLLADAPPLGMPLEATLASGRLHLAAPGADALSLARIQPSWPVPRRGVPDPFSVTSEGRDRLDLPLPAEGGWYRVTATWAGQDVQARRLYLAPPRPPGLQQHGLHPAPDRLTLQGGDDFHLPRTGATVATAEAGWLPAATLLAAEASRLTRDTSLSAVARSRGDIRLLRDASVPAEGFRITVATRRVEVRAADLRGAVYGALAVADLLAAGRGQVPAMTVDDAPDIGERPLLHQLNLSGRGRLDLAVWRTFLRRVVLRGRYNQLYLGLLDSYAFTDAPVASPAEALSRDEVRSMIAEARALGLEVFPAVSAPGNAAWLTDGDPGLRSGGDPRQLCPRNPAVPPLLEAIYAELWSVFDAPRRAHIGHDEVRWDPARTFGDERDPFCAGVPPRILMAESLQWHIAQLHTRGAEAVAWTDALVEGWNGGAAGTAAARAVLSPADLLLASWGPAGDSVSVLGGEGFRVQRIHTGYYDWKRDDYPDVIDQIAGEGLGLYSPFPWAAFGGLAGSRPLPYHWGSVLLAGATAWRADLARTPVADTLHHAAAENLPAYRPGLRQPAGDPTPLQVVGRADPRLPLPDGLPALLEAGGLRFDTPRWAVGRPDAAVQIPAARTLRGVSLLQAVATDVADRQRLQGAYREPLAGPPLAVVHAHYADGQELVAGALRYGLETYEVDGDARAAVLWGTAGSAAVGDTGLRLWRWDWDNPRPDVPLRSLSVESGAEGAAVIVAGALGW